MQKHTFLVKYFFMHHNKDLVMIYKEIFDQKRFDLTYFVRMYMHDIHNGLQSRLMLTLFSTSLKNLNHLN